MYVCVCVLDDVLHKARGKRQTRFGDGEICVCEQGINRFTNRLAAAAAAWARRAPCRRHAAYTAAEEVAIRD